MAEHSSRFLLGARLQGWVTVAILVAGAGLGIATLSKPGPQQKLHEAMTLQSFLAGRTAAAVNDAMAHDLPIGGTLSELGGILRWRVFGSGGPQVSVGCNDWLYLTEELRPWPGSEANMARRIVALHSVAAALKARGIDLVVAVVPDKTRIQSGTACGVPYSAQSQSRLPVFLGQVHDLPVVDLSVPFAKAGGQLFYRTDTHWDQRGAAIAAEATAAAVHTQLDRDHKFTTAAGPEAERPGDLLRLMSLEAAPDGGWIKLRPRPDREAPDTTAEADAPAAAGSLLDDAPVPEVALIGSSYSVNANFHGRLEQALSAPVGQFAQAGGAFSGAARAYFKSPAFRETPPKLVIWEIPERVINQPIDADEAAFLANPLPAP